MRLAKALGVIFVTGTVLSGCGPEIALDGLADGGRGVVAMASAGDTVILKDGRTVRLAGVEAPHGDEPYAAEAKGALERLAKGREVMLLHGGARADAYGRTIAQLRDRKTRKWLEGELLEAGAVRARTYADNRALARQMQTAEAKARLARRGLWALPAYQVKLPEEVSDADQGFVIVEGRVGRVVRSRSRLFIDFERRGARVVSAETPLAMEPDFAAAGVDFTQLNGRIIRVRGALYSQKISLDHPEQVELLKIGGR